MGRLGRFEFFDVCKNFDCDLHASSFAIKIDIGNEIQISEAPQEYAFVRYLSILLCFSKYQYDYLKSYKCTRDIMYARKIHRNHNVYMSWVFNFYTFEHFKKGYSNDTCFGLPKNRFERICLLQYQFMHKKRISYSFWLFFCGTHNSNAGTKVVAKLPTKLSLSWISSTCTHLFAKLLFMKLLLTFRV